MKKILYFATLVAAALSSASCIDQIYPKGTDPTPAQKAGDVTIEVSDVNDNSFVVTIAPKEESSYYSYLVEEGEPEENINPNYLYQVKYSGLYQGTVKYQDAPSFTFSAEELDANTVYTVYAVAGSPEGNVGVVAYKKVTTSDVVAPQVVDFEGNGTSITVTFSEPVVLANPNGVKGGIWYKCFLTGSPYNDDAPLDIEVDGDELTATFKDANKPGAYFTLSFEEGAITDVIGNPLPAYESKFTSAVDPETGEPECTGAWSFLPNGELKITVPEWKAISDWTAKVSLGVSEGVVKSDCKGGNYTTSLTHVADDGTVTTTTFPMEKAVEFGGNYYDVFVVPAAGAAKAAAGGDKVSITIPAGEIMDWWGNVNSKAITVGPATTPMSVNDIVGCYKFSTYSVYYDEPMEDYFTISDAGSGLVQVAGTLSGGYMPLKITAAVDMSAMTITFPSLPILARSEQYDYVLLLTNGQSLYGYPLGFNIVGKRQLTAFYNTVYWAIYKFQGDSPSGWYDVFTPDTIEYYGASAPASVKADAAGKAERKAVRTFSNPVLKGYLK